MSECNVCATAIARYAADGFVRVCDCGRVYGPDAFRWPVDTPPPSPIALPQPSASPPARDSSRIEDAELVRVRRLLCELRPERSGPLGWGPYDGPPSPADITDDGRSIPGPLAARIRVQCSRDPSPIPREYGASAATLSAGCQVAARIDMIEDQAAAQTLWWLQRHGSLSRGLGELYRAVGQALATTEQRARWKASRAAALDGPRVVGHRRVSEAMRVWWGEATLDACIAAP